MTDLVARLRLEASAGNTVQVIGQTDAATRKLGQAGTVAAGGLRQAEVATAGFERSASSARATSVALGGALAAIGGKEIVGNIKDAAFQVAGLQTGLAAVTGGALGAADAQSFVAQQSARLGVNIRDNTEGYLQLAAATNGTGLAGQKTKDIWLGLNEASAVLGVSQERQKLAMEAISQMANKGVVSQEELRQQLAESLPGAYQVAAKAMGKTTQEFGKLVASGKLLSEDFLPKFAAQLQKDYGSKLDAYLTSPIGRAKVAFAEFKNTTDALEASAGAAFLGGFTSGLQALNAELKSADTKAAAEALGHTLGEGLATAAQGAAFLVGNLDKVALAGGAVVAIGLAQWLVSTATEARAAAAAYLAKGQAAEAAGAISVTTAQGEVVAVTSLRGAVVAAAEAEVAAASAARDLALANEQAAAAALAQARAQAANLNSTLTLAEKQALVAAAERDLAGAQMATVSASARAEGAAVTLAKATTAGGAAAQGAKALFGSLMAMLGGPWGVALLGAAAVVGSVTAALAESKRVQDDLKASATTYAQTMRDTADYLGPATAGVKTFSDEALKATTSTNSLADSVRGLTIETMRYASAKAQATDQALAKEYNDNLAAIQKIERPSAMAATGKLLLRGIDTLANRYAGQGSFDLSNTKADEQALATYQARNAKIMAARNAIMMDERSYKPDATLPSTPAATTGKPDKGDLKAAERAHDLEAARVAQDAYTQALITGGAALDDWRVKDAGRLAVERLSIDQRKTLTAAEQALIEKIRTSAEETERLKIANERIEKSIGIQKSAEADTKALQERSAAAAQGEAALEELQVKEAGVAALQQIGVDTLSQLTGETLKYAKGAVAAAEAKEQQAIATAKAERVAAQIRDLDERIAAEKGYAEAVAGGTEALVAYQRQEFERQEIERAGKTLTADQVAAIRAKADALFAMKAAADSADLNQRQAEELRLARMTNDERAVEERYLQRKSLLLAQHVDWTKEEVDARARALALADEAAAQDAKAKGELRDGLKQAFIESGHLGFADVGDFVERRLREAVYNALLAQPIDILINAVIGSVSGMNALGVGSGVGQLGGAQGLGSLFTTAGALKGLTSAAGNLALDGLGKLGYSGLGAAKLAGGFGSAVGGAGTGMLVSQIAGLIGLKQSTGSQVGSTIGGAIGSFIPIPGGSILGSIAGNLIGGLIGGKESNHAAVASLDSKGAVVSMDGAKRTDATTAAAAQIAQAVQQIEAALTAGGATLTATVSKIDIGTRDPTHLNFSNGQSMDTAVGDVAAAIDAATKTILANAKWATDAQTAYAHKMLAAGATIDQVVAGLQTAAGFTGSIDDAIAQLTDPAAYAKKQALDAIDANYQALKKQAQELITAGIATQDVLGKIDQLKDLQVADALKRLGAAADGAAAALDPQAFQASIASSIAQLKDPTGYERNKALADIDANIDSMKAQATALVEAGKLSTEVFGQLDQLRTLQVADSVKKLGDAASDTAKALKDAADAQKAATDFSGSIEDAILQITDPVKAKVVQITRDYEGKVAQAQQMIEAGLIGADVLDRLSTLRDLQIDEALKSLSDGVTQTVDAFAQARPRLQQWLDSLALGANSPLNPVGQRGAALEAYQRTLSAARGGDADALSQITSAADALLSADRNATSSASDRLSLYNSVQSDIRGLMGMSGASVGQTPETTQLIKVSKGIDRLVDATDPALVAIRAPAPIEVKLSPWLQSALKDELKAQTTVVKDLLEKVVAGVEATRNSLVTQIGGLTVEIRDGLNGLKGQLGGIGDLTQSVDNMAGAVDDLTAETRTLNASVRAVLVMR